MAQIIIIFVTIPVIIIQYTSIETTLNCHCQIGPWLVVAYTWTELAGQVPIPPHAVALDISIVYFIESNTEYCRNKYNGVVIRMNIPVNLNSYQVVKDANIIVLILKEYYIGHFHNPDTKC